MKPLGDDARSLIDDAAGAYEPTAEDKKRLRSDVGARIAAVSVGIGVAATTTSVTTTTAAKTAMTAAAAAKTGGAAALGTKIGAVVVVASAAVVGVWFATSEPTASRDTRDLPTAKMSEREPAAPPPPVAPGGQGVVVDPPAPPEAPRGPAVTSPVNTAAARVAPAAPPAPKVVEEVASAKPSPSPAPPPESETSYVRKAETAIDAGDGITALKALDDHGKAYPDGILAGRRDVLRVIATCTVGRVPAAREQAEKYLSEHPRSAEAARIRRVCGTP